MWPTTSTLGQGVEPAVAATRGTNGGWTAPVTLATGDVDAAGVAEDGTGDAVGSANPDCPQRTAATEAVT